MATLNISLPDEMRAYVAERVEHGRYGSLSEYFRELVRADQDRRREAEIQAILAGRMADGQKPVPFATEDFDAVREHVRGIAGK